MLKQFAKSKTIIFASILAALGVVQASMEVFSAFLTPQVVGVLGMVIGVAVAVLRVLTTTSLGDK